MSDYAAIVVPRAGLQALETMYIIASSKNIETIKGRFAFLTTSYSGMPSVLDTLKQAQENPQYSTLVLTAKAQHHAMYPNSTLGDYQTALLANPKGFDLLRFYCDSLIKAMQRYCEQQSGEIATLKRESAKTKRLEKVRAEITLASEELQCQCSSVTTYSSAMAELTRLSAALGK